MKKTTLFLLLLIAFQRIAIAQSFEPQIKVGYYHGLDDYKNKSFGAEFLAGYRFNPFVRLGAGVGISYCDLKYEDAHYDSSINYYSKEYKESASFIPVFLNGKFNFSDGSSSPYFAIDLGYSIFISGSDYADENKLGLFFKPAFGIDFNIGKGDFFAEISYNYQTREFYDDCNYSQIGLSIGYQF